MIKLFNFFEKNIGIKPPKPTKDTNSEDKKYYEEYYEKLKSLKKIKEKVDSKTEQILKKYLPDVYRYDEDMSLKLNNIEYLLPLKNGVWNFKRNQLEEYKKEHYFSFKLNTNYNPEASTEGIKKIMSQWFKNDTVDIDFIQYWSGYSLTGYMSRKECLVMYGESGNNGKSTYWEEIMMSILENDKYFKNLKSEAVSNGKSGNNDGLYNLEGKRLARINEPREGFFNSLDNEIFKTISFFESCCLLK
jgi:phage/plasmid-associated DNA primase